MAVIALQHFARMRGGAQAQLLLASDGYYYIVKFQNNPQHRRVLANELLAHALLSYLQLPTAHSEIVEVGRDLVEGCPDLYIETGGTRFRCSSGLQFGSRYPGDPARVPVYDYVPDALLRQVANADCFLGMVAFDKWVSNADGRQAIFFRDRVAPWRCPRHPADTVPRRTGPVGTGPFQAEPLRRARIESSRAATSLTEKAQTGFVAVMIDHGFAFTAQTWTFRDLPQIGIYPRPWLYERVTGYDSFEPWLEWITEVSLDVLDDAFKRIPPEWYEGDIAALELLLEQLYARRTVVADLLRAAKKAPRDPFPNWR